MCDQNANNNGLLIALQMLLDTQIQLIKLVTQNQADIPNKEIMSHVVTTRENHQPKMDSNNRKLEENMDTSLKAYKACGE